MSCVILLLHLAPDTEQDMPKTIAISTTAAAALEDIACLDLADWAEGFAKVAREGSDSRDGINTALAALVPLLKQRDDTIDASSAGEVSKKLFNRHAQELTEMLAEESTPVEPFDPEALRAEVIGDRALCTVSAPLDLDLASELVSAGRDGTKAFAWIAVQVATSIVDEHERRSVGESDRIAA